MRVEDFGQKKPGKFVRGAGDYIGFVPNPLPPQIELDWELATLLSEADRALSELGGVARTLPNPHLLIQPFMRREAVLSSRIEGTQASLSDLLIYEASAETVRRTSDVVEVANYRRAIEFALVRLEELPLSLRLVREIHEQLLGGIDSSKTPGEFRRSQNWIGAPGCSLVEATYVPPPPESMLECLAALESFWHSSVTLPPIVRFALSHYQFEAIHPFLDGNGRVGRLLIVLSVCREGILPKPLLYLSAFFEQHRQEYYDRLMAVSRQGDWVGWINFFARGVREQARDAAIRAKRLVDLWHSYRVRAEQGRNSVLVFQIVDSLFERPITTVPLVARQFGRSYPGAKLGVEQLLKERILEPSNMSFARSQVYEAKEIRSVLEGPLEPEHVP